MSLTPRLVFKLLNAMAESRFRYSQRPARGREPAAIDHLHKVEEVVQIQHGLVVHSIGR
jgi:hypothetical protein